MSDCPKCDGTRMIRTTSPSGTSEVKPCPDCTEKFWHNSPLTNSLVYKDGDYTGEVYPISYNFVYRANRKWEVYYKGRKVDEGYTLASFRAMSAVMEYVSEYRSGRKRL